MRNGSLAWAWDWLTERLSGGGRVTYIPCTPPCLALIRQDREVKLFYRGGFTAVLMVGVVALNGVVDAKAVAARGAVCVRVGAKALDGVSGRGLVCANQSSWVALAVCANSGDDYNNCTEHVGYDNGCSCECCAAGCVGVGCYW